MTIYINVVILLTLIIVIYYQHKQQQQLKKISKDLSKEVSLLNDNLPKKVKNLVLRDARITAKKEYAILESYISLVSEIKPRYLLPTSRKWAASPDLLKFLYLNILENKPSTVVELGSGLSSLVMGYALEKNSKGALFSFDHDSNFADKTKSQVKNHDLNNYITVHHAPLKEINLNNEPHLWYDIQAFDSIGDIDLLIVDGPPASIQNKSRNPAVYLLRDKIHEKTTIVLDDGIRQDEKEIAQEWADFLGKEIDYIESEKGIFVIK